ncbi:MAG: DUF4932 domain-containing protein [Myxococcales bacterium]|nr:DUF4932 domain-containing protein [Myxococcales bacterium]
MTRRHLLLGGVALAVTPAFATPVETAPDPIVDWLAALARGAGFDEYATGLPAWTALIDPALHRIRAHPALRRLRQARTTAGIGYDALPSLSLHLTGTPEALALRESLTPWPTALDGRWKDVDVAAFLREASNAARKAHFQAVWDRASALRARATAAARSQADILDLAWLEAWFGFPAPGRVRVVPSLGSAPGNYGTRRAGRDPELVAVLGVYETDGSLIAGGQSLLVHELGRSFVSPLVDEHRALFESPGRALYGAVAERMQAMAYGSWETVVKESVLRAVVVRYLHAHGGPGAARGEVAHQIDAGFPWTLVLADGLLAYEADRARYPTFGDFSVTLAATLSVVADEEVARASRRPKLVSIDPAPGSLVPATHAALVATFDRPMKDRSWSIVGSPENLPASGEPRYEADGTRFVLPWTLTAGRSYRLALNSGRFRGFRSADGVPLEPVELAFSVAG